MGTVRGSSGKQGLNLIKMRQEVQDQKTELESQQNALSQAQELCSVNSVLKVKISLTEIELTQALKNVQARELKLNMNSQPSSELRFPN